MFFLGIFREGGHFLYPINLQIEGLPCLVIGGGHIALRKIHRLLEDKAKVTVLAPEVIGPIATLAGEKKLSWVKETYQPGLAGAYRLVMTACGIPAVAEAVHQESLEHHFLYNAADFPALGNCHLPASFQKGDIQVTVSTHGQSPAVSCYLKEWLMEKFPPHLEEWLERVGTIRQEMKTYVQDSRQREAFWHSAFTDEVMHLVAEGKLDKAEECVRHAIGCIGAEP